LVTLGAQVLIFGILLCTGFLLGLWLDLFRFINRRGKTPFYPLLDLLFWAVIVCIVFLVLINTNYLELRLYLFIGLGLGLLIYLKTLSRHILHLYTWGFEFIIKMIQWLGRILRPLTIPARLASGLLDLGVEAVLSLVARLFLAVFPGLRQDNPPLA